MTVVSSSLLQGVQYLDPSDQDLVVRALTRATELHAGQLRESGEEYIVHPVGVAEYLIGLEADAVTIAAALLHDVVEDELCTMEEMNAEFGPTVAQLIDGVTKLSKLRYEGRRADRQIASLRKMLLTASNDLRVIIIKLADRWHNVQSLAVLSEDKRLRVAHETLDIYVPFARVVGLWELKVYFEEICFPLAEPEVSLRWRDEVQSVRELLDPAREEFVSNLNGQTTEDVSITLDRSTDYELFSKFHGNADFLKNSGSIDSARIVFRAAGARDVECYVVLGEIHAKYHTRAASFRDYVSNPLPNGYRALHTNIFLSKGQELRLRIQTNEMYEYAHRRKFSLWIQKDSNIYTVLSSLQRSSSDLRQFMDDVRGELLRERMNVFTTMGEIITLPHNANGVDFAFSVNPDYLSQLAAIRINGELFEATHVLHEGDIVELVFSENGHSTLRPLWIDKVKSVRAREGIRESLQADTREERAKQGRSILEYELMKAGLPPYLFKHPKTQQELSSNLHQERFQEVLSEIGSGTLPVSTVVDAYRLMLTTQATWIVRLLRCFGLLPRVRVFSKDAMLIDLEIYAQDRAGLIHDITRCFAERSINIAKFEVYAVPPGDAYYRVRVEAQNYEQFSELFDTLLSVPSVKKVLRKN